MLITRYTAPAIGFHWLTFLLLAMGFALGLYMVDLPLSPAKLKYFSWHKWVGVTVFLLTAGRLLWRLTHPAPPLPTMLAWQRRMAHVSHLALYVLLFVTPLSGWIYSSAAGLPTVYLGLIQLPDLVSRDRELAQQLKWLHHTLDATLAAFILIHIAAALKHHFLDRDGLLRRMWFTRSTGELT